jgi:3-oxoacyl-[acyl-carrier-protein] synthase II
LDRNTAIALMVAQQAYDNSGLSGHELDHSRIGVFWGAGMAGAFGFDQACQSLYIEHRRLRPTTVVSIMPNAPVSEIALWAKAQGITQTYSSACASSAVALGEAMLALRAGRVDVAIVGGSEAMLTPGIIAGWHAMRVLCPASGDPASACKPFDVARNGFTLGEGAAALILETEAHAKRRGAGVLGQIDGYGISTDAVHITNPDSAGQVRAIRMAMEDAGLQPDDIAYINAHGTATLAGDRAEATSIAEVFSGVQVPVSSTKALHGHLLGAGGAFEFLITLLALRHQSVPVQANLTEPDPACQILVARPGQVWREGRRHALSNSFAFGGTNAVLALSA